MRFIRKAMIGLAALAALPLAAQGPLPAPTAKKVETAAATSTFFAVGAGSGPCAANGSAASAASPIIALRMKRITFPFCLARPV